MPDETNPADPAPTANPSPQANPAEQAFGKYRTRLAAFPDPASPWGPGAWPAPPSAMPLGSAPPAKSNYIGAVGERLGDTVKLSIDLLNAALYGAANALAGMADEERRGGCGCEDQRGGCGCSHDWDCCGHMDESHCRPHLNGCGY
jgi:hypothetical protein